MPILEEEEYDDLLEEVKKIARHKPIGVNKDEFVDDDDHVIINIYAHASRESLWDAAEELGLSETAISYFKYAEEYEISVKVEKETGAVVGAKIGHSYRD